ncbi:MAG: penicillin-binding protein 2 [Proteobacteria bacterium]|nr:penicillin-binding protein 2 [Pseudomonadota bacterium]
MVDNRFKSEVIIDPRRIYLAIAVFAFLVLSLVGRLWYLQILKGKDFAIASERNRVREVTRPSPRGLIFDRNGSLMLSNRPFFDLVIIPQYLQNREQTLKIVSELFSIPLEQIEKRLAESASIPHFVPIRIKRNLTLHEVAMMESNKFFLPGVDVDTAPRRDYQRSDSAHLFGYLGEVTNRELDSLNSVARDYQYKVGSIIGKMGVEKKYENSLRGIEGKDYLQVDAFGRLQSASAMDFGLSTRKSATRGNDVVLTIDDDIQRAAVEAFRNKNGAVVAMNAQNGEILAYVSHPNFSLSMYQDGLTGEDWQLLQTNPFKPLLDKVTGGEYPPGSVFKIITALAALEEGVVSPQRTYSCNGVFTLGNGKWRCWKKTGHGVVNLRRSLEESCDVFYYQVGNLLGVDRIAKWSRAFGLGEKTGLDLNLERPGLVPTTEWKLQSKGAPWQSGDTINVSIGQGYNLMTPLQIVTMMAAVGNGGKVYKPYLLKKIVDANGNVVAEEKPVTRRKISYKPENMAVVRSGLEDVVMNPTGTGKRSAVAGFRIAGKTGTAQTAALKRSKDQDEVHFQQRDHAWFAAYAPAENPEIAVVALSEFDGGGGGAQAAPIVQKVLEAYLRKAHPEKFASVKVTQKAVDRKTPLDEQRVSPAVDVLPPADSENGGEDNRNDEAAGD